MTAAVILGAAVQSDGGPSPTLRRRTMHAVSLFKAGTVNHIICCGGLGRFPPSEAVVMQQLCLASGLPETAIVLEDQSRSTLENLINARALMEILGIPEAVIVTDRYHKWRAAMTARHFGITASVSCPTMDGTARSKVIKSWLREIPGLIYYWWILRRFSGSP